jgi:hypothetical protein
VPGTGKERPAVLARAGGGRNVEGLIPEVEAAVTGCDTTVDHKGKLACPPMPAAPPPIAAAAAAAAAATTDGSGW